MAERIGIEEVLKELSRIKQEKQAGPRGFTTQDVADSLNITSSGALSRIRSLVHSGKVAFLGTREGAGISGRRCQVPVYGVVKKGGHMKPKKKKGGGCD